ncbi:hypothetical protein E2C01_094939 [Portunus trituberculatus]|uniref:Uncharacterized protein n=1 Tax=Portunus trituberculatus TaxID=210409 RepID=A0A5B7JRT5_PORTR|nr:hypothetical protein [Portunus trituberculatus]
MYVNKILRSASTGNRVTPGEGLLDLAAAGTRRRLSHRHLDEALSSVAAAAAGPTLPASQPVVPTPRPGQGEEGEIQGGGEGIGKGTARGRDRRGRRKGALGCSITFLTNILHIKY